MSLFDKLSDDIIDNIYDNLDIGDCYNLSHIDYNNARKRMIRYEKFKIENINIPKRLFIELPPNHPSYEKLYKECPMIKDFPEIEGVGIAGGFINIAVDHDLEYSKFPTSDIDIFIMTPENDKENNYSGMKERLSLILKFFDGFGAKYKNYFDGIVNVYIPNYHRNFQIICHNETKLITTVVKFHASNVKCYLQKGILRLAPECEMTIRTKYAIINKEIDAYTTAKILKRGYKISNYENLSIEELEKFNSFVRHDALNKVLEKNLLLESDKILDEVRKPCNFSQYGGSKRDCQNREHYSPDVMECICVFSTYLEKMNPTEFVMCLDHENPSLRHINSFGVKTQKYRSIFIKRVNVYYCPTKHWINDYLTVGLVNASKIMLPPLDIEFRESYPGTVTEVYQCVCDQQHFSFVQKLKIEMKFLMENIFRIQIDQFNNTRLKKNDTHDKYIITGGIKNKAIGIENLLVDGKHLRCIFSISFHSLTLNKNTDKNSIILENYMMRNTENMGYYWRYNIEHCEEIIDQ